MTRIVNLVTPAAEYHFHQGRTYVEIDPGGPRFILRPATRRERARLWLRDRWLSATRWWRPRTVCAAVDVEAGVVSMATERWSWRRWRWERV